MIRRTKTGYSRWPPGAEIGDKKISDQNSIYLDPRHYDILAQITAPDDLPFYLRQAGLYGGPILALACGTGRVCLPLTKAGFEVSGLDASGPMLSYAKAKADQNEVGLDLYHGDCREFDLAKKFKTIVLPYNSINHLVEIESVAACLMAVGRHLDEDGRFIIDTFQPSLEFLGKDTSAPLHVVTYLDPDEKVKVVMTETSAYDHASQVNKVTWHYEIGGKEDALIHRMDMRIFFPQELDVLVRFCGFEIERKFGNYDESAFDSESPKQIMVCKLSG